MQDEEAWVGREYLQGLLSEAMCIGRRGVGGREYLQGLLREAMCIGRWGMGAGSTYKACYVKLCT